MLDPNHNASPVNSVPPLIVSLVVVIGLIELAFQAGHAGLVGGVQAVGWRAEAQIGYGFAGLLLDRMWLTGSFDLDTIKRIATYSFIHINAMHAVFACVMLLAMGKFVGERVSSGALIVVLLAAMIAGAVSYAVFTDTKVVLIGAYPMVYGLLGTFTCILFVAYEDAGENRIKAFQLIAFLLAFRLVFSLIGAEPGMEWIAELFAFAVCFVLSFALIPGGRARVAMVLARLRDR